jgi:hypothetical protein
MTIVLPAEAVITGPTVLSVSAAVAAVAAAAAIAYVVIACFFSLIIQPPINNSTSLLHYITELSVLQSLCYQYCWEGGIDDTSWR